MSLYTDDEAAALGAQRLTFRWEVPAQSQIVSLGRVRYRVRAVYRRRLASWYIDLLTQAGDPVLLGRRVTAGWALNLGHHPEGDPLGLFVVSDVEPYRRDQFGNDLSVTFYPISRLKALPAGQFEAVSVSVES